ncbi:ABC transporter permease [Gracilibacillus marinus]|jgi:ABC-2 type transport system permease protein|uniref:ABC transporter permease n=2 Tax=Gracilibacillus marinus TaxID=630535 RepID=A0ABV8VZM8_9BACI
MPMLDGKLLFQERFKQHLKELNRYLKYIFTGHLAIAMFFMFSALAVYYQQWLQTIPDDFPSAFIIAVALGFFTTYTPIQTLLKKADIVFLLPAEQQLSTYFIRTLVYSYVTQLYMVLIVYVVLAPLYLESINHGEYGLLLLLLLIIKCWSLIANWWMLKVRDQLSRRMDYIVRFLLISGLIYFFIEQEIIYCGVVTILLIVLFGYNYLLSNKSDGINWELLIERDYLRMRSFYRLANMFTEVPHLETTVKKRALLATLFVQSLHFKQSNTFSYLYRLTTARSSEYMGIYIRLLVLGIVLIYYIPNIWVKLLFGFLFSYMTFIQFIPLWKHHISIIWLDLYPIPKSDRLNGFINWIQWLMAVQMVVFTIALFFIESYLTASIMLIMSILFVVFFIPFYIMKKTVS